MFAEYNDYVLNSSRQLGWITEDQEKSTRYALDSLPGASAIRYLEEQQILTTVQCEQFRRIIQEFINSQESTAPEKKSSSQTSSTTTLHVNQYLEYGIQKGASDIHLSPFTKPTMRHSGELQFITEFPTLSPSDTEALAHGFLNEEQIKSVHDNGSIEFSYHLPGKTRFRTSVVRQRRGWEIVFRIINPQIKTMEELGLPEELKILTQYHNGLVLVTGSVGSGASGRSSRGRSAA